MADSARKQAVRRFYEPYGTGDLDLYDSLLTPDWTEHEPVSPDQRPGPANYKPIVAHVRGMFPDIAFAAAAMVEEGDVVAIRSTLTATHTVEAFYQVSLIRTCAPSLASRAP